MFCQGTDCLRLTPEQCAAMDWSGLPESHRELRRIMGALPAAKLILACAGQDRLYVPERMTDDHALTRLVGMDAARKLSEECGGCQVGVPSDRAFMARLVFDFVQARRAEELSVAEIQASLRVEATLTTRRIRQIIASAA